MEEGENGVAWVEGRRERGKKERGMEWGWVWKVVRKKGGREGERKEVLGKGGARNGEVKRMGGRKRGNKGGVMGK